MIQFSTGPENPQAPGCYGSALTFKAEGEECRSCPFARECGPRSQAALALIRAKFGIEVKAKPARAPKVETETVATTGPMTSGLPKKVEETLARLDRAGFRITESLAKGINPFGERKKPAFLLVTCHLLLNFQGALTREVLRTALMRKLNWSQGTAAAHAIQAAQILVAVGAATESNGILKLKRA